MIDQRGYRSLITLLAGAVALAACSAGPPPPPDHAAPPATSVPHVQASAAQSAAAPPAAAPSLPTARVTEVASSPESVPYVRAKVLFENGTTHACRLTRYTLIWGTFKKSIPLDRFALPPGEGRERWIRVNPEDGDINALSPKSARVEVEGDCKG